ncbi:MAG: radical SAM protein [Verrucomicrobia bacterium]|nr:radical SAM protein [Verrucomicrobiota bacterium]
MRPLDVMSLSLRTTALRAERPTMRELAAMPWIQLFASPACNLRCPYCSSPANWRRMSQPDNIDAVDALQKPEVLELVERIPPTSFYLSGGEPLIHPGVEAFVSRAIACGHVVSFDTNLCVPVERLAALFDVWDPVRIGFVNVSHHIAAGITFEYLAKRVDVVRERRLPHFVKYIGAPEDFSQIDALMPRWRDAGTGTALTILQGDWQGRRLPEENTLDEVLFILGRVTLGVHGLQLFNGIQSHGMPCRGGQDYICYNMDGRMRVIPCCCASAFPGPLHQTFFCTGSRTLLPCPTATCRGDNMFIFDINGVAEEADRFEAICAGRSEPLGLEGAIAFIRDIEGRGYEVTNKDKLERVAAAVAGRRSVATSAQ